MIYYRYRQHTILVKQQNNKQGRHLNHNEILFQ